MRRRPQSSLSRRKVLRKVRPAGQTLAAERRPRGEAVLRDDPCGAYARQDFTTRDRYRRTVEQLARGSELDELEIARRVVRARSGASDSRQR